ncbi:MAG TPA: hypothetical protein PLL26_02550 [Candidatus Dojkabacteria bacterium]|nr:hypothetical protein [Candidatus Dojkabacteria bacterium]
MDFELFSGTNFRYFGILIKTTDKKSLERIGRLCIVYDSSTSWDWKLKISKNKPEDIKWLEETDA